MVYKWCVVPQCSNTSIKSSQKLFVSVPTNPERRQKWLQLAGRDPNGIASHTNVFMCEDHFNMEKDTINYMKYKMGFSQKILLANEAMPSKFQCQEDRNRRLSDTEFTFLSSAGRKSLVKNNSATITATILDSPPKKSNLKKNPIASQDSLQKQEDKPVETERLRDRSVRLRNRKAYLANRRCSVPQCNKRPSNEVSLHPCPNIPAVRNEWAEALNVSYQFVKNMVACSIHFNKLDFIQSKSAAQRVLKQNAVPSRNMPALKREAVPVKSKVTTKVVPNKAVERQMTMTDTVDEDANVEQKEEIRECRACLKKLDDEKSCCDLFQAWAPPWAGMEATIAEDLAKLANVEISISDRHSKVMCAACYTKLLNAATFAASVRDSDLMLRQRFTADLYLGRIWPKPIQVDKNINGAVFNNPMGIEIKQEVLSDEEDVTIGTENAYAAPELENLDIKIEPEEIAEPPPMNITINGTISLDPLNSENKGLTNGPEHNQDEQYLQPTVKQEPMSEEEQDVELAPDLSLECLLCAKSLNSVSGLKAHVIAQHSYKTVKRKSDGTCSPQKKRSGKHQCAICKRSFQTSTDLMVHETCHNKHACYGCNEKFDSFEHLTRHRKRCKASISKSVQKPKTLEDVKRPLPDEKYQNLELGIQKQESEFDIKEEDIEMKEVKKEKEDVISETEDIKSETEDAKSNAEATKSEEEDLKIKSEHIDNDDLISDKKEAESMNQETGIQNEGETQEDPDSSMKLHLEIHSTKNDTVSTEVSDASMQAETLNNDETT